MKIFYRASSFLSSNPNPMGTYKPDILKRCFDSFLDCDLVFGDLTIINGGLFEEDKKIFKDFPMIDSPQGNIESFHKQLDLIAELPNEEKVFLVEDDYLWVPGSIKKIERALDEFEIVFPYDHPGHYTEERFKHQPKRMVLLDGQTYRDCPSNTLTFATRAYVIKQNLDLIKSFGIRDHELFQTLGIDMWIPVPSFATHLVTGLEAPNVDWQI